jgi:hypothetical protein
MSNDLSGGYGGAFEEPHPPQPALPSLWLPWAKEIAHNQEDAETAELLRQELARVRAELLRALAEEVDPE